MLWARWVKHEGWVLACNIAYSSLVAVATCVTMPAAAPTAPAPTTTAAEAGRRATAAVPPRAVPTCRMQN